MQLELGAINKHGRRTSVSGAGGGPRARAAAWESRVLCHSARVREHVMREVQEAVGFAQAEQQQRREWGGGCSLRFLGGSQPSARTCPLLALAVLVAAGEEPGKGREEGAGRPFEAGRGLGRPSGEVGWRPAKFFMLAVTYTPWPRSYLSASLPGGAQRCRWIAPGLSAQRRPGRPHRPPNCHGLHRGV